MTIEPLLTPEQAIAELRKAFGRMTYETPRGTHTLLDVGGRMLDQLEALAKQWHATEMLKAMREVSPVFIPVGTPEGLPEVPPHVLHQRAVDKAKEEKGTWWSGGQGSITVLGERFEIVHGRGEVMIDVHGTEIAFQTQVDPAHAAVRIREILVKRALLEDNRMAGALSREDVARFVEGPLVDLDQDPGGTA